MRKEKGITLIALIITIILLLILASVVLNITLGENGLFKTASGAAKKYKLEEMRERIELAISDIVTKEIILGNEITVENVLQELLENGTFETIDKEAGVGTIDKYDVTLKKNEDGSIIIESIEETTGVRVTYKLDPKSYTNSEKVTIQFKAVGEVKSVTKPNGEVAYPNQGKAEVNYEVDKNGTYKFIVENKEGIPVEKEVLVDTIDRLPPLGFTITANQVEDKLVVTARAEDQEPDGTSVKSGIDRYEYFVKKATDTAYPETPYTTNEIEILEDGTYNVYVKAYDKAGNNINSNEISVFISFGTYIFNYGDTCDGITGGWSKIPNRVNDATAYVSPTALYITGGTNVGSNIGTNTKIDFSKFSKVAIYYKGSRGLQVFRY